MFVAISYGLECMAVQVLGTLCWSPAATPPYRDNSHPDKTSSTHKLPTAAIQNDVDFWRENISEVLAQVMSDFGNFDLAAFSLVHTYLFTIFILSLQQSNGFSKNYRVAKRLSQWNRWDERDKLGIGVDAIALNWSKKRIKWGHIPGHIAFPTLFHSYILAHLLIHSEKKEERIGWWAFTIIPGVNFEKTHEIIRSEKSSRASAGRGAIMINILSWNSHTIGIIFQKDKPMPAVNYQYEKRQKELEKKKKKAEKERNKEIKKNSNKPKATPPPPIAPEK